MRATAKVGRAAFGANQIYMMLGESILRRRVWLAGVLGFFVLSEAHAAFNGLVPLSHSGQLSYNYNYIENAGSQSDSTSLLFGWNASGYVWRPWFATTSLALSVGLSSTESTSSSSEGTVGAGSFSLGVFPRSRFPFSMSYARTDSRSQQFQDISQTSGSTGFRVTRLTMRQSYRPRANNQLFNGYYGSTQFEGDAYASDSEYYGLTYQRRASRQLLNISANHSATGVEVTSSASDSDVLALSHVYTPSAELGVSSALSYVQADPGGGSALSIDSQAFSSFFWRPEHRAFSVSGGVRLNETKSEGSAASAARIARGINTSLALGYRISRSLNMSAGVSLGASESRGAQTLSTTQTASLSYAGAQRQWGGYSYIWQWNASASNAATQAENIGVTSSTKRQSVASGIGHNLAKSWSSGAASSLAATFSQSVSGSINSEVDNAATSMNHGMSLSWNTRGRRGSTYISSRVTDSRSYGDRNTVFDSFGLNFNTNMTFGRLSSMSGNMNFQASESDTEDEAGQATANSAKNVSGNVAYRHTRPFGVYNLFFTTKLQGSRQVGSTAPSTTLRWEGTFRYRLGLLSTSLGFRASESAGGNMMKSMNFQATRSF